MRGSVRAGGPAAAPCRQPAWGGAASPPDRAAPRRGRERVSEDNRPPVDDLFGDDGADGGVAPPPAPEPRGGRGRLGAGLRLILVAVVLVLGALFWWASRRHHDVYYLTVDDGLMTVERGLYLPFGRSAYQPSRAYEPLRLPDGIRPEHTGAMNARQLDRVLIDVYFRIAEHELTDLEGGDVEVAEDVLRRALKLHHTQPEQERRALGMLGDVQFHRGVQEIRSIQSHFDRALDYFERASLTGGSTFRNADRWVETIRRLRAEFRRLSIESGLDPDKIVPAPLPPRPAATRSPAAVVAPLPVTGRLDTAGAAPSPAPPDAGVE